MTDSMTNTQPEGPFLLKDLENDARRDEIARQLKGVRWRMTVKSDYQPGRLFGFLGHPAFPDHVFFSVKAMGAWAENGQLKPCSVIDAEVRPNLDKTKNRWNFVVDNANPVLITDLEIALQKLRHYVSASWSSDDFSEIERLQAACLVIDPDSQPQIDQAVKLGQEDQNLVNSFYNRNYSLPSA